MISSRPRAYNVREACRQLCCGKTRLYEMISEGRLDARRSGGMTLIMTSSIDDYFAKLPKIEVRIAPKVDRRDVAK